MEEQVREVNARIDKRAGRPLWQAITFGLLLGGVFLASLFFVGELFMLFVTALVVFATLELAGALVEKGRLRSRWPLVTISAAMPCGFCWVESLSRLSFVWAAQWCRASHAPRQARISVLPSWC
jgi:hypothetical protein